MAEINEWVKGSSADRPTLQQLLEFLQKYKDRNGAYHDHKERMAYIVFAVIVGLGLLVINDYPPSWLKQKPTLDIFYKAMICWAWVLAHTLLTFQLKNRRIAALRVLAAELALVEAYLGQPILDDKDYKPLSLKQSQLSARLPSIVTDFWKTFWLYKDSVVLQDAEIRIGPAFVIAAVKQASEIGSYVTLAERVTFWGSWSILFATIVKFFA